MTNTLSLPTTYVQGTFWLRAFPVYAHYRLTEMVMRMKGLNQEEQNEVWDRLHAKHADEMLTLVKRLKGYYVKVRPSSRHQQISHSSSSSSSSSSRLVIHPSIYPSTPQSNKSTGVPVLELPPGHPAAPLDREVRHAAGRRAPQAGARDHPHRGAQLRQAHRCVRN